MTHLRKGCWSVGEFGEAIMSFTEWLQVINRDTAEPWKHDLESCTFTNRVKLELPTMKDVYLLTQMKILHI